MRESQIEKHLVKRTRELGGEAEKFTSPARRNVPDRLVLFPKGVMAFVELKATGKKPTAAQLRDHQKRRSYGYRVCVLDSISEVNILLSWMYNQSR